MLFQCRYYQYDYVSMYFSIKIHFSFISHAENPRFADGRYNYRDRAASIPHRPPMTHPQENTSWALRDDGIFEYFVDPFIPISWSRLNSNDSGNYYYISQAQLIASIPWTCVSTWPSPIAIWRWDNWILLSAYCILQFLCLLLEQNSLISGFDNMKMWLWCFNRICIST